MLARDLIRDHPDRVREALRRRHEDDSALDEILALDRELRETRSQAESLRARQKEESKRIGQMKAKPPELLEPLRALSDQVKALQGRLPPLEQRLDDLLLRLPNIPDASVPEGASEADNVVVRTVGEPPMFDFTPKPHWEIGERLGILDFERGVKVSGSRFYVMKGPGARLERALIQYMLDLHTSEHGYTEVATPYLVKRAAMTGTGQLPKFEEDAYAIPEDDLFLIPTAEVPVTNLHADEILEPGALPLSYVAYSPCFRREAGSAGKDTRGVIRVHQFDKVEMVKFVEPGTSYDELEKLVGNAETVLQRLGLAYRVSLMCTADVGFAAAKKFDPEVWMPGQNRYVEISSCSNFESFQARRANIRYRPEPGAKPEFVHTLNGSGLAVGRTLAAILENYQRADGSVVIPEVLRPYMGGREVIGRS